MAGAAFAISGTKSSGRILGANDTIRIGVAGLHGRGGSHVSAWLGMEDVQIAYLIDPDTRTFAGHLKNIERKEPEVSSIGHARQIIKIKQGIEHEVGKKISAAIKDTKLKVTGAIQDKQVRVTGKNRDDLQAVMAALKAKEFDVEIAFTNFRP